MTNRFRGPGAFDTVAIYPDRIDLPLRWRKPRRIFVNSMSDMFHDDVPVEIILAQFAVMAATPRHTYQILTKRHGRMRSLLGSPAFRDAFNQTVVDRFEINLESPTALAYKPHDWPLPNVWIGVSVEDQQWADIRIPALLATPAAVRFLSCEPLLGMVDLAGYLPRAADAPWYPVACRHGYDACPICARTLAPADAIRWIIAGGESGPGARPMHPSWARALRDQAVSSGVAFHFKQWGEWAPVEPDIWQNRRETDGLIAADGRTWPLSEPTGADDETTATIRRVGKRAAGRLLDGRTWDEYPDVEPD